MLERHGDCLTRLSALGRRVVLMRVGVDGRRPLSRRQVARRLDIPVNRVVREERGSVRRLSAQGGSCSTGADGGATSGVAAGGSAGAGGIYAGSAARGVGALLAGDVAAARSAAAGEEVEVAGASASGSAVARSEDAAEREAGGGVVTTPFGSVDPTAPETISVAAILAVLAALAALLFARHFRRESQTW